MNFLTSPSVFPFNIALGMILFVALLEGMGLLFSMSPSSKLESLLPEFDADGPWEEALSWLHLGRVPLLVVLLLFLMGYAMFGYALQAVVLALFGHFLPLWLGALLAVFPGMATVRGLGAIIAHLVPRDETSSVSENSLVGRVGAITLGQARRGYAAQARVKDSKGRSHYLMVEPDLDDEIFEEGAAVLLVRKTGAVYRAINNPHPDRLGELKGS